MPTSDRLDLEALSSQLDEALNHLGQHDRNAIALRFLNGKSLAEVGYSLGITEAAAGKRVQRALHRLRKALAARGFNSPRELLESDFAQIAVVPIPAALAAAVVAASMSPASASAAAITFSKGAILMSSTAKFKSILMIATAFLIIFSGAIVLAWHPWSVKVATAPAGPPAHIVEPTSATSSPAPSQSLMPTFTLKMSNGAEVEVIGICRDPLHSKAWFGPDGVPLEEPVADAMRLAVVGSTDPRSWPGFTPLDEYAYAVRVTLPPQDAHNPGGGSYSLNFAVPVKEIFQVQATREGKPITDLQVDAVYIPKSPESVGLDVTTACGPWEIIATFEGTKRISGVVAATLSPAPSETTEGPKILKVTIPGRDEDHFEYQLYPTFSAHDINAPSATAMPMVINSTKDTDGKAFPYWGKDQEEPIGYTLLRSPKVRGRITDVQLRPK